MKTLKEIRKFLNKLDNITLSEEAKEVICNLFLTEDANIVNLNDVREAVSYISSKEKKLPFFSLILGLNLSAYDVQTKNYYNKIVLDYFKKFYKELFLEE